MTAAAGSGSNYVAQIAEVAAVVEKATTITMKEFTDTLRKIVALKAALDQNGKLQLQTVERKLIDTFSQKNWGWVNAAATAESLLHEPKMVPKSLVMSVCMSGLKASAKKV